MLCGHAPTTASCSRPAAAGPPGSAAALSPVVLVAAAAAAPRPPPLQQQQKRPRCALAAAFRQQTACVISVDPLEHKGPSICDGPTCRIPVLVTALGAIAAAYYYRRQAELPKKKLPEPWPEIPLPDADPEAYQKALARTRQAQCVQRAIGYMRAGEPARSLVELHKALEENAVCRSPLLEGHQTHEELAGLYKLHIRGTEVPPNFAVLLQLRRLLGLLSEEAEQLEKDTLKESAAFDI